MRRLAALAVLLATVMLAAPAAAQPRDEPRTLRVMTYNIFHGVGLDGRLDVARQARLAEVQRIDVLALQEVDRYWSERSDFRDQAQQFADELGWNVVFGANLDEDPAQGRTERRQYGTAIVTPHRILSWDNTPLPSVAEQRGLLRARVALPGGPPVTVFNTHLGTNQPDRFAQIDRLVEVTDATRGSQVLVGDFNARPGDPELVPVLDRFVDAWAVAGEGDGFTIPVQVPDRRIDFVFVSPDITVTSAEVPRSTFSDHLPVVAELGVPARPPCPSPRCG